MANTRPTQEQRVLKYMETFGSITAIEAIKHLAITRLSARIYNLRNNGYTIIGTTEKVMNRYGEKCNVKRYRLAKGEK